MNKLIVILNIVAVTAKHAVEHRFYCSHYTQRTHDWIYTFLNLESVPIFNDSNFESQLNMRVTCYCNNREKNK